MAVITDYATLQTEVANTLARDDLTAEIPQFIQFAENKLSRTLNLRNEETDLNVAISSGSAAVPTDFKALKFAYFDQSPVEILEWVPLDHLYRSYPNRSESFTPAFISRQAGNFVFGPSSKDGTLRGVYYAKQDPLRTTDGSWYVVNAPELLLYGSLLEAVPFIKDDVRIPIWQQFYTDAINTVKEEERHSKYSKGNLVQRCS